MRTLKALTVSLSLLGILFVFPTISWAGADGDPAGCFSPNAGGKAVVGTVAAYISNINVNEGDIDAILELKYKSTTEVFRVHVAAEPGVSNLFSNEDALCSILAAGPINSTVQTISEVFGFDAGTQLQIDENSVISSPRLSYPNSGGAQLAIANVTIFVE